MLDQARHARLVADTIGTMTDQQALRMYQCLTGLSQGCVLDPIVSRRPLLPFSSPPEPTGPRNDGATVALLLREIFFRPCPPIG